MTDRACKHTILVVDDDPAIRLLLRLALQEAGYDVREAQEGKEGLRIVQREPCSLAVVDLFMPGKDGIETMLALRRSHPSLPVIAISGKRGPLDLLFTADALGAVKTLSKPFEIAALIAVIDDELAPPK